LKPTTCAYCIPVPFTFVKTISSHILIKRICGEQTGLCIYLFWQKYLPVLLAEFLLPSATYFAQILLAKFKAYTILHKIYLVCDKKCPILVLELYLCWNQLLYFTTHNVCNHSAVALQYVVVDPPGVSRRLLCDFEKDLTFQPKLKLASRNGTYMTQQRSCHPSPP